MRLQELFKSPNIAESTNEYNIAENEGSIRLKNLATVATNMPDADFWIIRKGSEKTVGRPIKEFDPQRIGVKVIRTDIIDPKYLFYLIMHIYNQGYFASKAVGITNLVNIRVADVADITFGQSNLAENFADGKGPGRPGDSQRHGIPKKATMAELEKASHAKGRKGQLARWQLNMRRGKKKKK